MWAQTRAREEISHGTRKLCHGESENMESCRKVGQWMLQNVVPYTDISTWYIWYHIKCSHRVMTLQWNIYHPSMNSVTWAEKGLQLKDDNELSFPQEAGKCLGRTEYQWPTLLEYKELLKTHSDFALPGQWRLYLWENVEGCRKRKQVGVEKDKGRLAIH